MVLLFLHLRVDMFMLNDMAGTATLGIYSLSVTLAETVMLGTDSVAIAILPRQMGNSLEEAALMALRAARMAALISAAFIAAWAVVGFPLIVLAFGRPFAGSYLPLLVLLPGVAFMGMQRVCGGPVIARGAAQPHRLDQRPEPHQQHRAESVVDPDVGSNRRRRRVHVLLRVRRDALSAMDCRHGRRGVSGLGRASSVGRDCSMGRLRRPDTLAAVHGGALRLSRLRLLRHVGPGLQGRHAGSEDPALHRLRDARTERHGVRRGEAPRVIGTHGAPQARPAGAERATGPPRATALGGPAGRSPPVNYD